MKVLLQVGVTYLPIDLRKNILRNSPAIEICKGLLEEGAKLNIYDPKVKSEEISLCLDYHINKCEGPCEGLVSENHYSAMVKRIKDFIKGRSKETVEHIESLMQNAAFHKKYEIAAMYRDQLNDIKIFHDKQKLIV